ncbi:Uncharacterised protein [Providencia stuartii]|nr:Uncharacterised protein [Providencia stuartii]
MEETSVYADRMVTYDSDIQWLYSRSTSHLPPRYQSGKPHYITADHQGMLREIFIEAGSGELRWLVEYVGHIQFWRLQDKSADNDPNYTQCHFRFAGLFEDSEPSLYYHRFRY